MITQKDICTFLLVLAVGNFAGCRSFDVRNDATIRNTVTTELAKRPTRLKKSMYKNMADSDETESAVKLATKNPATISLVDYQEKDSETDSNAAQTSDRQFVPAEVQNDRSVLDRPALENNVNDQFQNSGSYPIDFPTVLQLAGADNWNVKVARERVNEAAANYCEAKHAWMPSLTMGMGFNHHEGEIQSTEGDVIEVSRNSVFLGGGAGIQNSPLNGGSGGPPRLFVDMSIADAIYRPLAARRMLGAEKAQQYRVFNDTMLKASLGYYELVRTQGQVAVTRINLSEAETVERLTAAFVEAGKGTAGDTARIGVIVNTRRQQLAIAQSDLKIASTRLATILQLDPTKLDPQQGLFAIDDISVPTDLIDTSADLNYVIQSAQSIRCEIAQANAEAWSAHSEMMAEQWRPWLPNLYVGNSGGLFGGGQGSDVPKLDGRSDVDVVVTWQLKNLGYGNRARQNSARSRMVQRSLEMHQVRDQIAEQVTTTFQRVLQYQSLVGILGDSVSQAGTGLEKNLEAIKGLEGLPLESISSLEQLATARSQYLDAVVEYNQWQIRFLRAAGQPLAANAPIATMANCNACSNGDDDCETCCQRKLQTPTPFKLNVDFFDEECGKKCVR